jgi:hypothetical protein
LFLLPVGTLLLRSWIFILMIVLCSSSLSSVFPVLYCMNCISQALDPTDSIPDEYIVTELSQDVLQHQCPASLLNVKDEDVNIQLLLLLCSFIE